MRSIRRAPEFTNGDLKWKAYVAEFLGSFWLVVGGCGCAILAATGATNGIGALGVSLAFGLAVMTAAYVFGGISGGHFNPAVSLGCAVSGRTCRGHACRVYVVSQVAGALLGAGFLYLVASGRAGFDLGGFAANGFDAHSPGGFPIASAFLMEAVCTALFVLLILAVTASPSNAKAAPAIIGAMLTLIHLILIPVTNASVNPARSTSQALIVGNWAIGQLWVFWGRAADRWP